MRKIIFYIYYIILPIFSILQKAISILEKKEYTNYNLDRK